MINGLEGIPGSGKSYEAVAHHVLAALRAGRKVITNLPLQLDQFAAIDPAYRELLEVRRRTAPIRGTWDANRVDENGNGHAYQLFEDGRTEEPPVEAVLFGQVWDYYSTWKHPDSGQGPMFVVDECHVAMPKLGTDKAVIEWFKLHRHFNSDVLLMTQSFRDMDQSIAKLLAMLIRVRKADIMGKKDAYIRKVHGGYRGALVSDEIRKYQPQFFPLYKSHTQGNSVGESAATDVAPFLVKWRRMSYAVYGLIVVATLWAWWPSDKPAKPAKPAPQRIAHAAPAPSQPITPSSAPARPAAAAAPDPAPVEEPDPYPEPYAAHRLHVTGWMQMGGRTLHTFAVFRDAALLATVNTRDLERAGYIVQPLSECAVVIAFGKKQRTLVCDVPRPAFDGNKSTAAL